MNKTSNILDSITSIVHDILQKQEMTPEELFDCLGSEPYNLSPDELKLVPVALKTISGKMLLSVNFSEDRNKGVKVLLKSIAVSL